jgi:hypothetical protein
LNYAAEVRFKSAGEWRTWLHLPTQKEFSLQPGIA